jgi:microcompartment protein CcmL/EutN
METRTKVIPVELEDGTVIKVQAAVIGGAQDVVDLERVFSFAEVTRTIEKIAGVMLRALQNVKPTKASVEFGVEVVVESGALSGLLVKGSGTGNLNITLEWEGAK